MVCDTSGQQEERHCQREEQYHQSNIEPKGAPTVGPGSSAELTAEHKQTAGAIQVVARRSTITLDSLQRGNSQEEKECEDTPQTQHHLQSLRPTFWNDLTGNQDNIDTIAQPEATVGGQGGGSKHVVPPELPHAGQQLDQTAEEQSKCDGDVCGGAFCPYGVSALQEAQLL